jgi:hypothetical protein
MSSKQVNCINPMATHEIKNILSSAKLSLEMLTTYDFDSEDRKKLTLQAFDSVNQLISVFEELLKIEISTKD